MQIIAFASQKGGSGKTTLAGHLAVQAERSAAGLVAMVDTDPQGSLSDWWNARAADTPYYARVSVPRLEKDLERMRLLGIDLLVVDTPPAITSTIAEVIRLADLVVIPTRPSPHDLRAAGRTVDLVERVGKPMVFVINAATPRARITNEAVIALSQHGTLAPSIIHHRTDFAASMIDGRTVMEIDATTRSAEEVAQLWNYLGMRLQRLDGAVATGGPASEPEKEETAKAALSANPLERISV